MARKKIDKKIKELQDCEQELKGREVLTKNSPQLQPMINKIYENNPIEQAVDAY